MSAKLTPSETYRGSAHSRFVILRHECPPHYARPAHWDLMLLIDGKLRTWALSSEPGSQGEMIVDALPDHRPEYLDFEGAISGGRGSVTRWDWGTFYLQRYGPNEVVVVLHGQKLRGRIALNRIAHEAQRWRLAS